MAKITKTDDFIEAFTTAKPPALGDKSMFGTSAIAAAVAALDAKGSKVGGVSNSPISGKQAQRFVHKHRISRYEFEQLPLEYKQQKMELIARQVGKEIAEKYMALVETTDGNIEIGIDIEVRG